MDLMAVSWRIRVIRHSGTCGWLAILIGIALFVRLIAMLREGVNRPKIWMMICLGFLPLALGIGGSDLDLWKAFMWASRQAVEPHNMEQWLVLVKVSTIEGVVVTGVLLIVGVAGLFLTRNDNQKRGRPLERNRVGVETSGRGMTGAGRVLFLTTAFVFLCVFLSPVHAVERLPEYTSAYWWWDLVKQLWNSGIRGLMAGGIVVVAFSLAWMLRRDARNWRLLLAVAMLVMFVGMGLHIVQRRIFYLLIVSDSQMHGLLAAPNPGYWDALLTDAGVLLVDLIVIQAVCSAIILLEADVKKNVRIVLGVLTLLVLGIQINNLLVVRWWHYSRACDVGPFNFASCMSPVSRYDFFTGAQSLTTAWTLIVAPGLLVFCAESIYRAAGHRESDEVART